MKGGLLHTKYKRKGKLDHRQYKMEFGRRYFSAGTREMSCREINDSKRKVRSEEEDLLMRRRWRRG